MIFTQTRKTVLTFSLILASAACTPPLHAGRINKTFQCSKIVAGSLGLIYSILRDIETIKNFDLKIFTNKSSEQKLITTVSFLSPLYNLYTIENGIRGLKKERNHEKKLAQDGEKSIL